MPGLPNCRTRGERFPVVTVTAKVSPRLTTTLLLAAQAGDRDAIDTLLARARPDVRRYARRTCKTASDMDDATQEALILVYRRIGSLRVAAAFSGWVFRIVDRLCLRLARQALQRPSEGDLIDAELMVGVRPDAELRLDLAAAIEALPDHYRAVVLLRDIHERTIAEIADQLGATVPTVKARLHRARALMRDYLIGEVTIDGN